jgi:uncharacterized protein (TIGR02246 family)
MKTILIITAALLANFVLNAQDQSGPEQAIITLVDQYGQARVDQDTELLKSILVPEVDQLVSNGEWRRGIEASLAGMVRSSTRQPGSRSLTVEQVRFITGNSAIADARYVIDNDDGTQRKMWSTFIMVSSEGSWKIAAIRNMLPAE